MNILTPNRALAGLVFANVLYFVLAAFIPPMVLREVFTSLAFGVYVVITVTWLLSFIAAMRNEGASGKWRLILGIFWLAMTVSNTRVYTFIYNKLGRPDAWTFGPMPGYWSYCYLLAGVLILSAVWDNKDGPGMKLFPLMVAAALGGAAAMAGLIFGVSAVV